MKYLAILFTVLPWTILWVRTFDFALESPMAERIIGAYLGLIAIGFIISLIAYVKKEGRPGLLTGALLINGIYFIGSLGILALWVM